MVKIHEYWLNLAIDIIKKAQDVNVRVKWGDEAGAREVITRRKRELRVEDPEDEIMDEDDYEKQFGDWQTNGLGHKLVDESVRGILMPGRRTYKIKRSTIHSSEIRERVRKAGDFELGTDCLETIVSGIADGFDSIVAPATGASLHALRAMRAPSRIGAESSPASNPPSASASASASIIASVQGYKIRSL